MPTHKPDLSELSLGQLVQLTGSTHRTIKARLRGLKPIRTDGRTLFYDPQRALPMIFKVGNVIDLQEESARLKREQARGEAMKNAKASGSLLERDDVVETWSAKIAAAKRKLRAVAGQAQTRIPRVTRAMARELLKMIDEALDDLSGDGLPAGRRGGRMARGQ